MKELSVTEFRSQCLSILENVPEEGITITKRGKPIARVLPLQQKKRRKGKMIFAAMITGGTPGPAMGDGLTTPYDLIFD